MTDRLHPTPRRLAWLDDAEAGRLPELLSVAMGELLTAGWIEPAGVLGEWRITALGRAIRAVRLLVRVDHQHIVAETGDGDSPRVLGDATRMAKSRWLIHVNGRYATRRTAHEASAELRHMAATALAADPAFTVQEGH